MQLITRRPALIGGALAVWLVWLAAPLVFAAQEGEVIQAGEGSAMKENGRPEEPLRFLFIHHSCGGQLLAEAGEQVGGEKDSGQRCIYQSHPNGGGLRKLLEEAGFEVHEASYGSQIGEDTDIHHWRQKFANRMGAILACDRNDTFYEVGGSNRIVAFKSCYPNNRFLGEGTEPGDPDSPELTVANARAAYGSLLPLFADQPEVLFVAFTAPPLAEPRPQGILARLKALFGGKPKAGRWARQFNTWLADRERGWLAGYELPNVVVFDYYDILTGNGAGDWSAYPTGGGTDSHPSCEGNRKSAEAFVPFLTVALREMEARSGAAPAD